MALTSRQVFETYVPVNKSFTDSTSIDDFIIQAEENYLIPVIGQDLYDQLATTTSPNEAETSLLKLFNRAVSFTALWLYIPFGTVQISDSGFQIVSTTDRKNAFEWQVVKIEKATAKMGMAGIELLLRYLEKNIDAWPAYKNSEARQRNNAYLLNSALAFNAVYNIDRSRLTYMCLLPLIMEVEDTRIRPLLGTYYTELIGKINNGGMTDADNIALKAIQRAAAYQVIVDAIPQLSIEISPMGLAVNFLSQSLTTQASTAAPDARIESALSAAKEKAKQFMDALPIQLPGYTPPASGEVYNIDPGCNSIVSLF